MKSTFNTLVLAVFFGLSITLHATHIVGGDISARWLGGSTYRITLNFFRDCGSGSADFDNDVTLGIYSLDPTVMNISYTVTVSGFTRSAVSLGDNCYNPTMCMEKAVYYYDISLLNNPAGYYISYSRCCRNLALTNVFDPNNTGYVMYCEIPDPALQNSNPVFNTIPDGYMCLGYPNADDFSCKDIDGDSLVYSFVDPLSCAASINNYCNIPGNTNSWNPGAFKKPYGTITWGVGYGLSNQIGDPAMAVSKTGIVTTTPPTNGVFVYCVRVEEYRNKKKIGEVRRDFQFKTLPCHLLNVNNNVSPTICSGASATLALAGLNPAKVFTYSWSPGGQTTSAITVTQTAAGTYTYNVTATSGLCVSKTSVNVVVNENPGGSTVTTGNVQCYGGVATASISPTGGLAPYTYSWQTAPIQTAQTATGLTPGTYSVVIKDANSCSATKTVTIAQPANALSVSSSTNSTGCNLATGTATVTATGGWGPNYLYSWNTAPIQTTAIATGMLSGIYSVIVTDQNGCSDVKSIYIPVANGPTVTATVTNNVSCFGTNTGSASTSNTIGGTLPYQYLWSPTAQTTANATGLYANISYTVLVTDKNNCKSFSLINVKEPPLLTSSNIASTNISCYLGANGSATVTPTGGTPSYAYAWSTLPAQYTNVAVGLSANTVYSVTVTDSNKCVSTSTVTLTHPNLLSASVPTSNMPSCFQGGDGSATAAASGGTAPYTYFWDASALNQTTVIATGLSTGIYKVTITDTKGCKATQSISINQPTQITGVVTTGGYSCAGSSLDGSASVNPSGGTPPYYFLWTPTGKTTQTINNIKSGTYSVTITDGNSCTNVFVGTLKPSIKPDASFIHPPSVACEGVVMNFKDQSSPTGITEWEWAFGDGKKSNQQNPSHTYVYGSGNYNVSLIVKYPPCADTTLISVKAGDLYDFIQFKSETNIFTPNGDGSNDCFSPVLIGSGVETLAKCMALQVYDRWGVKMFESSGTDVCWKGNNIQNNKPAADGVYYYYAKLANKREKGTITLIRTEPK
jgi:gliding motility-associated-like protein